MAHDVYISYSSQDKPVANTVCQALEKAGISCWIAPRDINPGEKWSAASSTAIKAAAVMVLIFSAAANNSKMVTNELILGAKSGDAIIPFKIDQTMPGGAMRFYLSGTHWMDAADPPTENHLNDLIETVKLMLGDEATAPAISPAAKEEIDKKSAEKQGPVFQLWATRFVLLAFFLSLFGLGAWVQGFKWEDIVLFDEIQELYVGLLENGLNEEHKNSGEVEIIHSRGNSIGNIVNYGLAAGDGDELYYSNCGAGSAIYKIHPEEDEHIQINEAASYYINAADGWIYYMNADDGDKIYRIRTDGRMKTRLNDHASEYITAVNDWIFYVNLDYGGLIYKMRTDGSMPTSVGRNMAGEIIVVNGWIYYTNLESNHRIYKIRTDGSDKTRVTEQPSKSIIKKNNWVYYINREDDHKIYKIRPTGVSQTRLTDEHSSCFNVVDDWIYYANTEEGNVLYKIRTDGSEKTQVNQNFSSRVNVVDDWIYYVNRDADLRLYRILTDGSYNQQVNRR